MMVRSLVLALCGQRQGGREARQGGRQGGWWVHECQQVNKRSAKLAGWVKSVVSLSRIDTLFLSLPPSLSPPSREAHTQFKTDTQHTGNIQVALITPFGAPPTRTPKKQ